MAVRRKRAARRKRVGDVSIYQHRSSFWIYYREGGRPVRRRIGRNEAAAAQVASQVNAELTAGCRTLLSFEPIAVAELRRRFLADHEHVRRSSLATVQRYGTATLYLERYAATKSKAFKAHQIVADDFVRWLRGLEVAPNGHASCPKRHLRATGLRFILTTCRTLFRFAAKRRHLPAYSENPFGELRDYKTYDDERKPVFVFDAESELRFLEAADDWSGAIHFTLAKTGMRPGELARLLIEDLDLDAGWLHVRGKPELGWRVKTRRERAVPIIAELDRTLTRVIGSRTAGPVFVRRPFQTRPAPLPNHSRAQMAAACHERLGAAQRELGQALSQTPTARVTATVWHDAGAIDPDDVRRSFVRLAGTVGLVGVTCPKSWRHTFATLLQDANVDPLIRQVTLGHAAGDGKGALGMTGVYTHTRPETQKREIERALRLWPRSLLWAAQRAARLDSGRHEVADASR